MTYQTVGESTLDLLDNSIDIIYTYDPTNGNTQTKRKFRSDDITDSNRSVFDNLTKGQRDAILGSLDNTRVEAAGGVISTPRLKHELRQYEIELAGDNDTVLGENGFFNTNGDLLFNSLDLKTLYSDEAKSIFEGIGYGNDDIKPITGIDFNSIDADPAVIEQLVTLSSPNTIVNNAIADLDLEFELTDSLIKTLTNLKYPEDALYDGYTQGQDYIRIKQYKYQPPNKDLIQRGGQGSVAIGLQEGLARKSARKQQLGLVRLPMPNQIQDSNNVSWGPDQISNITAAVASGVLPRVSPENLNKLLSGDFSNLLQGLKNLNPFSEGQGEGGTLARNALSALQSGVGGAAAQGMIGSKLLNMAGFDVSAESILARGRGVIPNNNMELLFNAPALREFQFNWKMSPRSQEEAMVVNKIIKFFKAGMAVKKQSNTGSGSGSSYFLGTPNIFDVQFITTGNEQIDGIMRIKECACTACAVNYTPEGNWSAYEEGQPVSVIMTLKFSELEPIYDIDYLENKPAQYRKDNGIDDLPANAIGY